MWKRVIAPTGLVIFLWVVGSAATSYYIAWQVDANARVLNEDVVTLRAAAGMQDVLGRMQALVIEASMVPGSQAPPEILALETDFERHLAEADRSGLSGGEQVLTRSIREHFQLYRDHLHRRLDEPKVFVIDAAWDQRALRLSRDVAQLCKDLALPVVGANAAQTQASSIAPSILRPTAPGTPRACNSRRIRPPQKKIVRTGTRA